MASKVVETPEKEFENITRSLNFISSRLAFHGMRINANHAIMNSLIQNVKTLVLEAKEDHFKNTRFVPASAWLEKSLVRLQLECQALLLEVACNQKIAQSQLEIVYNLVAQRDNKDNLRLAKISTEIAAVTKDDSFAMRTVAVMSITFLPGTFVASFFSMSMFNWQASGNDPVLSSRFWIYWAVTLPLTLLVLSVWLSWLHHHKRHEPEPLHGALSPQVGPKSRGRSKMWYHLKSLNLRSRGKAEDDVADAEADGQSLRGADAEVAGFAQPVRVETLMQGPRR